MSYHSKIVPELHEAARARGLPAAGRKEELVARLLGDDLKHCTVDRLKVAGSGQRGLTGRCC
jgi:hypothetical protein